MKKNLFLLCVIFSGLIAQAQSLTPQVIASAGNYFENSNFSISWTLGEPMIETYTTPNTILTQGFHQPELLTVGIPTVLPYNTYMNLYPNPTMQNVTFDMKYGNNALINIDVINNLGQIISTQNISVQKDQLHSQTINLQQFASGMYQIRISENGQLVNSYKVNKVN